MKIWKRKNWKYKIWFLFFPAVQYRTYAYLLFFIWIHINPSYRSKKDFSAQYFWPSNIWLGTWNQGEKKKSRRLDKITVQCLTIHDFITTVMASLLCFRKWTQLRILDLNSFVFKYSTSSCYVLARGAKIKPVESNLFIIPLI